MFYASYYLLEQQDEAREPILTPVVDGWAVHGATREEALENYRKAEQRRKEILAMPPWYKPVEAQSRYEEHYA